jgi:hypothetical protein
MANSDCDEGLGKVLVFVKPGKRSFQGVAFGEKEIEKDTQTSLVWQVQQCL